MTQRPYNFAPGPATLPQAVLEEAQAELLSWQGTGVSVMEMSHRGPEFTSVAEAAQADLRELLQVPSHFRILFMQGGAWGENAIVPMNLVARAPKQRVDVVVSGAWSAKSLQEAKRYADVACAASNEASAYTQLPRPEQWRLRNELSYVHLCSNETIHGVEFHELPDLKALGCDAPLVVDCSSHLASRRIDWSRVGLAFGGAQKNIGPAGLTLVFVREDLLGHALPICPSAFNYQTVSEQSSMFNTPPTFSIYMAGLVFKWILRQRVVLASGEVLQGLSAIEHINREKAELLYAALDASQGFYVNRVEPLARSRMNVPFFLREGERLNEAFLREARALGLLALKGHKAVGGMRASIYNAMPIEGVQALVAHLNDFARRHG